MKRILLHYVLPLALPFVAYAVWVALERWRARTAGAGAGPAWREAPWHWLLMAGVVLVGLSFVVLGFLGGAPPGSKYVPPHMEGGELVPGRME